MEGLGKLVDHELKQVNEKVASYIQDTPDLLRKLEEVKERGPLGDDVVPFSLDVVALYPSVPTKGGLKAMEKALTKYGMRREKIDWVKKSMEMVLMSNTFEFEDKLYTQKSGTSIGAPPAGAYAGLFMSEVEEKGLKSWNARGGRGEVLFWKRFIDDCFGLWKGTREQFEEFVLLMNTVNENIKFTFEIDFNMWAVNFLDITISIDEQGIIQTDLYTKLNMKNQLLLPSSDHPMRTTGNIVFSLAMRIVRICSKEEWKNRRMDELRIRCRERKFPVQVIEAAISRANLVTRDEAIKKVVKESEKERRHKMISTYDSRTEKNIKRELVENWKVMIERDKVMGKVFQRPPMAVFKRGKTLKEMLTKAKVPANRGERVGMQTRRNDIELQKGFERCSKGRGRNECRMCPYAWEWGRRKGAMVRGNEVVKEVSMGNLGPPIEIKQKLNCRSSGVVYIAIDLADGKLYAGQTGREARKRLGEHIRAIENNDRSNALGDHFNQKGHGVEHLAMIPVVKVMGGKFERVSIERNIINRYGLVKNGMNKIL